VSAAVALACAVSFEITTRDADPEGQQSQAARRREVMPPTKILQLDEVADLYGG
jgi:hypothetical protein